MEDPEKRGENNENNEERGEGGGEGKLEFRGVNDSKLENFWYYNKWKVIIGIFAVVIIGICVYQFIERENPDVYMMYAGPRYLSTSGGNSMREAFRTVVEDYNNDGERGLGIVTLTCLTDEQIENLEEQYRENDEDFVIDKQANRENIKQFDMEIFGGESVICLLDPSLYDRVHDAGGFVQIKDIFTDEELEGVELYDSTGIVLHSLKFAKYYSAVGALPEDTVLCIRKVSTISAFKGKKKYEEIHENHVDTFRNIVLFEYPEGYVEPTETTGTE